MNLFQTVDGYHTTILAPLMIFGWIFFSASLFFRYETRKAVLWAVVGGILLLPMARYDVPGFHSFDKIASIAIGIVLGTLLSGKRQLSPLSLNRYDIPMLIWCFLSPLATSLTNGLGLYDGLSGVVSNFFRYGVYFWIGRRFFTSYRDVYEIIRAILFGGILYIFLILYEIRMSPLLSYQIYGFFPHSWGQHYRYGGYRPIIFMQHGLMVAFWMAASTTVAYWLWREKKITRVGPFPMSLVVLVMVAMTILCRSANGWTFLMIGIASYSIFKRVHKAGFLRIILLCIVFYIGFRLNGLIAIESVEWLAGLFFDDDRIVSLLVRLRQEELFGALALQRPLFGWGGYNRGRPIDPATGLSIRAVDSMWVILFSSRGMVGLVSVYFSMGIGAWLSGRIRGFGKQKREENRDESFVPILASLIVVLFLVDSLLNAFYNPVFMLISGALVSVNSQRSSI